MAISATDGAWTENGSAIFWAELGSDCSDGKGKRVAAEEIFSMVHHRRDLSRPRVCSAGGTNEKE
jgi:hypothetical protein